MSFPLAYSALRWQNPKLEQSLVQLREAGWDGWEARQSLDWLGSARRVSQICDSCRPYRSPRYVVPTSHST